MPSLSSRLVPLFLRASGASRHFRDEAAAERYVLRRRAQRHQHKKPRLSKNVMVSQRIREGWKIYELKPQSGSPRGAVVYLHGGAWINSIVAEHWRIASQIALMSQTTVIIPIYPLIPFGTAADVNSEIVALVLELRSKYGPIGMVGDSAGGQIALSAVLTLRNDFDVTLPYTVLITPAVDPSMTNPEIAILEKNDPWLTRAGTFVYVNHWRGEWKVDDPRVNALKADLRGLGPLPIFSGTRDILHADAKLLAERASMAGVSVEYHEGPGLLHVYPLMPIPEGRAARSVISERLRCVLHNMTMSP
jgi:acetyl esterase/lipase